MVNLKPLMKMIRPRAVCWGPWLLVAALSVSGAETRADSTAAVQGGPVGVRLNFVVHIPESLFLQIGPSHRRKAAQLYPRPANPAVRSEPTASVSAVGSLAASSAMALSSQGVTRIRADRRKPPPVSSITWTSGGVIASDNVDDIEAAINTRRGPQTRTYTFRRTHPSPFVPEGEIITYTLSSP